METQVMLEAGVEEHFSHTANWEAPRGRGSVGGSANR